MNVELHVIKAPTVSKASLQLTIISTGFTYLHFSLLLNREPDLPRTLFKKFVQSILTSGVSTFFQLKCRTMHLAARDYAPL